HDRNNRCNADDNPEHRQQATPTVAMQRFYSSAGVALGVPEDHFLLLAVRLAAFRIVLCDFFARFGFGDRSGCGMAFINMDTPAISSSSVFFAWVYMFLRAPGATWPIAVCSLLRMAPSRIYMTRLA